MKKTKNCVAFIIALIMLCSCSVVAFANTNPNDVEYIPLWMEPHSVIVYDANGNSTIVKGGYLSEEDIIGREDIEAVGFTDTSPDMIVTPNTKVEYDLHGFLQNIYYLTPGTTNQYQLSNPMDSRIVPGGIMPVGTFTYPDSYYNYDTGRNEYCKLIRVAGTNGNPGQITGIGRITFYTGLMGDRGKRELREYDCATKASYDDIRAGTPIIAMNTVNDEICTYYKYDVGGMKTAILDIWSDDTVNPITYISTNGRIDNVYSGMIVHDVIPYDESR